MALIKTDFLRLDSVCTVFFLLFALIHPIWCIKLINLFCKCRKNILKTLGYIITMNPCICPTSPPLFSPPTSCVTLTLTSRNADYTGSLTQCLWSHSNTDSDRSSGGQTGGENQITHPKWSQSSLLLVVERHVSAVRLESCTSVQCLVSGSLCTNGGIACFQCRIGSLVRVELTASPA